MRYSDRLGIVLLFIGTIAFLEGNISKGTVLMLVGVVLLLAISTWAERRKRNLK